MHVLAPPPCRRRVVLESRVRASLVLLCPQGGATLNSIRVAQWILSGMEKGEATTYVGCIGKGDEFGAKMKAQLATDKVKALFMETDEKPTGTCAVLVKDGERSLIANLAAAEKYSIAHFKTPEVLAAARQAEIFYMAGFPLTHEGGAATVKVICQHALDNKKTCCMNVSAPFLCMVPPFFAALCEALTYCAYVFCNESEAAEFAKAKGWGEGLAIPEIAKKMAAMESEARYGLIAVVTQGADKTIVAHPPLPGVEQQVNEYDVMANPWELTKEKIKDTNGAGDAFVGGFLSQLALGSPEAMCVRIGHFAAGAIIQQSGCTCPDISTVDSVL